MLGVKRYSLMSVFMLLLVATVMAVPDFSELEDHKIEISDIYITKNNLECKATFPVMIEVRNTGSYEEDVTLELRTEDGKIEEITQLQNLKPERIQIVSLTTFFKDQPRGPIEFEVIASYNKRTFRFFKSFNFKCEEQKPQVTVLKSNNYLPPQEPVTEQEQATYPISLTVMITAFLLFIVFILVIMYIIKLYAEK